MSLFKCSACDYKSYFKVNVEKHINKKNKCSNEKLDVLVIDILIQCEHCQKIFSSMANKNRHFKICKEKLRSNDSRIKKLEEENNELRKMITQPNVVNNTTNTTNKLKTKQENHIIHKHGIDIIRPFDNNAVDITIRGTHEEPLFRVSDIGEILDITKISELDQTEKVGHTIGSKEILFLTEKGLYKLLFKSRELIAKQFTDWICEVIKEIRLNGKYELEQQLQKNLLTNFSKKPIVYIGYTEENIIKTGYTNDIERRLVDHKKYIGSNFTFEYVYESVYNRGIERKIYQHPELNKRRLSKIYQNKKEQTELFQLDKNFTIKHVDKIILDIKKEIENGEIDKLKLELTKKDKLIEELNERLNKFRNMMKIQQKNSLRRHQ